MLLSAANAMRCASSLRPDCADVQHLTDDNFKALVTSSEEPWLVEFFAPW